MAASPLRLARLAHTTVTFLFIDARVMVSICLVLIHLFPLAVCCKQAMVMNGQYSPNFCPPAVCCEQVMGTLHDLYSRLDDIILYEMPR